MTYTPPPAQPSSGQDPWYDTMDAWMDGVESALAEIDAHSAVTASHVPGGGTNGQVLSWVAGAPGWAAPSGTGGTTDHGLLTGLSDPDHPIGAVSGLQAALDAKAVVGHTHSGFEPVGTSASTVATHAGLADPHPGYLTPAEANALYAVLANGVPSGGTTGQVLGKLSNTSGNFGWITGGGGGVTAPLVLTSPNATDIALTAKGAAGQSVNIAQVLDSDSTVLWSVSAAGDTRLGPNVAGGNGQLRVGIRAADRQGLLVKMFTGQTGKPIQITDAAGAEVFHIKPDGTVVGANVGGMFKSVIVLDAAEAVPENLPNETVLLRRPA